MGFARCGHFIAGMPEDTAISASAALEAQLEALVAEARKAWSELAVEDDAFLRHAGGLAASAASPRAWLDKVRAADLWLAFACGTGVVGAAEAFETAFADDFRRIVARFSDPSNVDDLRQELRDRLFVAHGQRGPRLLSYAGSGYLQNWLRITATRLMVDRRRKDRAAPPPVALDEALAAHGDFEVDFLKERYRGVFRAAFADATRALLPAERNLLRQRLEGLNVDQIGALLGIHRSTAARRLEKARHRLLAGTKEKLAQRLDAEDRDAESVIRLVQTLDLSLERLLQSDEGPAPSRPS